MLEESEGVRVWREPPSVLWDINSLRYGFFIFFSVHTEPPQLSAGKSEKGLKVRLRFFDSLKRSLDANR